MTGNSNEQQDKITVRDDDQPKSAALSEKPIQSNANYARLLRENDAAPATMLRAESGSPFLLVLDHAGRAIPAALAGLGLGERELARHIAWDIGVAGTGGRLAESLDAALVAQTYSRLVIDCNRTPGHPTSIAQHSDGTTVPGNRDLADADRDARVAEIFTPYHDRIAALLDARTAARGPTVLVALHSFTPRLEARRGRADRPSAADQRPWHAGVLHNHDPRFAVILRDLLRAEGDLVVGDNEPYALSDEDDYTVPVHAERRRLPHVEIEIRQDLIGDAAGEGGMGGAAGAPAAGGLAKLPGGQSMTLTGAARLAGLIGWPVSHSRSPLLHNHWLARHGIDGAYVPLPVAPADLERALRGLQASGFAGLNVTVPHKQAVAGLCDTLDAAAHATGSVNTLVFAAGGRIEGSSSDGAGFIASLLAAGIDPAAGPALLLGAGGAARAIAHALLAHGAPVLIANRTAANAEAVARALPGAVAIDWGGWPERLGEAALLVNTTILGMTSQAPLGADLSRAPSSLVVADIVYAPRETALLAQARARGLRTVEGIGMLLHQAVPGFAAWFGVRPVVDDAVLSLLAQGSGAIGAPG